MSRRFQGDQRAIPNRFHGNDAARRRRDQNSWQEKPRHTWQQGTHQPKGRNNQTCPLSNNGDINGGWQEVISKRRRKQQNQDCIPQKRHFRTKAFQQEHAKAFSDRKCFRCLEPGHVRAQCREPPKCYKCHKFGHLAAKCTTTIKTHLKHPQNHNTQTKTDPKQPSKTTQHITYADIVKGKESLHMAEEFWEERPEEEDIYLTPHTTQRPENEYLNKSAFIRILRGEATRDFPMAVMRTLAAIHGGYPAYYKVFKVDSRLHLLVCADQQLRDDIVRQGPYEIMGFDAQVQFEDWTSTAGMPFHPPGYEAWVQVFGVPHHLLNDDDLKKLAVKLGTIKYIMPYGLPAGQFEYVTMYIATKHPRRIPKFLKVLDGDYGKRLRVKLLGWRLRQHGYFPPPQPPNQTIPLHLYPNFQPKYNYPNMGDQIYSASETSSGQNFGASSRGQRTARAKAVKKTKLIWVPKKNKMVLTKNKKQEIQPTAILSRPSKEKSKVQKGLSTPIVTRTLGSKVRSTVADLVIKRDHQVKEKAKAQQRLATPVVTLTLGSSETDLVIKRGQQVRAKITRQPLKRGASPIGINWLAVTIDLFPMSQSGKYNKIKGFEGWDSATVLQARQLSTVHAQLCPQREDGLHLLIANEKAQSPAQQINLQLGQFKQVCTNTSAYVEEVNADQMEQTMINQPENDEGPPPGFTEKHRYSSPTVALSKGKRTTGPTRKSLRLEAKNQGPYMSAIQKASRLKGDRTNPRKKQNSKPFAQPDFEYLKSMDPLTTCQAELVVATAGIKMEGDLSKRIKDMTLDDGEQGVGSST